jgi:hypothetical protein
MGGTWWKHPFQELKQFDFVFFQDYPVVTHFSPLRCLQVGVLER